jgi:DivIVA domain-containing protein
MPEERLMSITSSSHLAPDDVARHTFGSVRRGFDPGEVRAYLESIAMGLRGIAEREHDLLQDLADAEHRAANPVLDEATLTAAVGAETARVLHSAHEVATEATVKAKAEAELLLTEAGEEIEQSRARHESWLAETTAAAETAIGELRQRTDQQIATGLEAARAEAEEMLSRARDECRAMVDEAQGLRARVLADLSKRRKVLHAQIEQLRAGRERLTETVQGVRRSIDDIAEDLFAAEDNARLAAEAAGRLSAARPDEGTPEDLAALLLAEEGESPSATHPPEGGSGLADGGDAERAPAEVPAAEGDGDSPVDALFAKIRASREETDEAGEATPGPTDTGTNSGTDTDTGGERAVVGASAGTGRSNPEAGSEEPEDHDGDDDPPDGPPDGRPPAAIRRDELIDPIVTALARRLKRTLQDNQNELLDSLRSRGATWSAQLLPDQVEQIDGFATAALPGLEQAAEAGVSFAGTGASHGARTDVLVGIAHELAEAVVGPLRRRLTDEEGGLAEADESVVVEHVGSAFREWKGERIERLAGDHVVAAFSAGTLAAVEADASGQLEWLAVAGSGDAPCPDCEDNGLGGPQRPGAEFPTGHLRPPAHPGCRCLLSRSAT